MIDKLPDDTQLQVILMDELRPGDVVIVNTRAKLDENELADAKSYFQKLFSLQTVVLNPANSFDIDIKRPGQERRKDAQQSDVC